MRWKYIIVPFALASYFASFAQEGKRKGFGPEDLPTSSLISRPGPSFVIPQKDVTKNTKIIVYGDQRFTDPSNTKVTNPVARSLLVQK